MAHRTPKKRHSPISLAPSLSQPWQLQAAKAQFSEVFRRARERAPQVVTRQGKEAVVIVALEDFERLTKRDRQPKSLSRFFAESPLGSLSVGLERKPDYGRKIEL
jgi:prevent-host-death family protein